MDKRFSPSKKRLEKARKEGNLSKSQYLSQFVSLFIGLQAFFYLIEIAWVENRILIEYVWVAGFRDPLAVFRLVMNKLAKFLLCLLLPFVLGGIFAELWQVGFSIESSLLSPAFKRVDPLSGSKKIFQGFRDLWLLLVKLITLLMLFFWFLSDILRMLYQKVLISPLIEGSTVRDIIWQAFWCGILCFLSLAALDYFIRYRRWYKQVAMSLQEMKDDHREDEGDPLLKGSRRAQHQALLQEDLLFRVRNSKVIIVERESDKVNSGQY